MQNVCRVLAAWLLLISALAFSWPASANSVAMAPFRVDPTRPDVIELDGDITPGSGLAFRRAIAAAPDAKLLVLNSPGGTVQMGLLIADDVHRLKLATLIPSGSECMSACAYIFLAGNERQADGALGVHQISSDLPDLEQAQMSISDIIDVLNRFETPVEVLTTMFRTPPDDMHVFSQDEVARYQINRKAGDPVPTPAGLSMAAIPNEKVEPTVTFEKQVPLEDTTDLAAAGPAMSERTAAALSTLESYTRQPTRMAIYAGLDFFGGDVGSASVTDAPACAVKCLEMGSSCKALTFNMLTTADRGPNCFLKSGRGEVDGNSAAFSAEFLARAERDPAPIVLDIIDPQTDLYSDIDIPGLDLSSRAHPDAKSQFACRRACVNEARCVAFTYVRSKKECWLKGGIGATRTLAGAVTGGKRTQTFTPETIALD